MLDLHFQTTFSIKKFFLKYPLPVPNLKKKIVDFMISFLKPKD